MLSWAADNWLTLAVVLGLIGVVLLLLWSNSRDKKLAAAGAVVGGLLVLLLLVAFLVETDSGQIKRKIHEMAAGVRERNLDKTFAHLSADFLYQGRDKKGMRGYAEVAQKNGYVDDVVVWDVEKAKVQRAGGQGTAEIFFKAKPKGNLGEGHFFLVRAEFVLEPDGQWRLKTFELRNPAADSQAPMEIPNLR